MVSKTESFLFLYVFIHVLQYDPPFLAVYLKPRTKYYVAVRVQATKSTNVKMRSFCVEHEDMIASRMQKILRPYSYVFELEQPRISTPRVCKT